MTKFMFIGTNYGIVLMAIIDWIQQEESNLPIMLSAKDSFSEALGKNEYWYIFLPVDEW